jgi:hypothetical protein
VRGFDAIAQLVEAGLGVAVMPAAVAQRWRGCFAVKVLALAEPWARREYLLAVRRQEVLPTVVQRFVDALTRSRTEPDFRRHRHDPMTARTLYDKLWDEHVVHTEDDGTAVLYIDRHLVHEVTSPQAFEGLRLAGRKVWRVSSIVATADHNTPTTGWERGYDGITDPISKQQVTRWTPTSRPSARRRTSRSSTSARASCT